MLYGKKLSRAEKKREIFEQTFVNDPFLNFSRKQSFAKNAFRIFRGNKISREALEFFAGPNFRNFDQEPRICESFFS